MKDECPNIERPTSNDELKTDSGFVSRRDEVKVQDEVLCSRESRL